jgi:hypothetical protein
VRIILSSRVRSHPKFSLHHLLSHRVNIKKVAAHRIIAQYLTHGRTLELDDSSRFPAFRVWNLGFLISPSRAGVCLWLREKKLRNIMQNKHFRRGIFFSPKIAVRRIILTACAADTSDKVHQTAFSRLKPPLANPGPHAPWPGVVDF